VNFQHHTYKDPAKLVGILYIIGTLAGIASVPFLSVRNQSDYLSGIARNPNSLIVGAVLTVLMGSALALIPIVLFPLLKRYNEPAAVGYVVFRSALETGTYLLSAVCYVALAILARNYTIGADSPSLLAAGTTLNALADASLTFFFFGVGALILYVTLLRYHMLPRWIVWSGIIAVLLHIASGGLVLLGLQTPLDSASLVMNLPIAVQEMVMAVWLLAKGFNQEPTATPKLSNEYERSHHVV